MGDGFCNSMRIFLLCADIFVEDFQILLHFTVSPIWKLLFCNSHFCMAT